MENSEKISKVEKPITRTINRETLIVRDVSNFQTDSFMANRFEKSSGILSMLTGNVSNSLSYIKQWFLDRLTHNCESSILLSTTIRAVFSDDGLQESDLEDLANYFAILEGNNILQSEVNTVSAYEKTLRIWIADRYTDYPVVKDNITNQWKVNKQLLADGYEEKVDTLSDALEESASKTQEQFSYYVSVIQSLFSGGNVIDAIIANGLNSDNDSVRQFAQGLSGVRNVSRPGYIIGYFKDQFSKYSQILSGRYQEDADAGSFNMADYAGHSTQDIVQGAWSLIGSGITALGTVLLVCGGVALKIIGVGFQITGSIINAITQAVNNNETLSLCDSLNNLYANGLILNYRDPLEIIDLTVNSEKGSLRLTSNETYRKISWPDNARVCSGIWYPSADLQVVKNGDTYLKDKIIAISNATPVGEEDPTQFGFYCRCSRVDLYTDPEDAYIDILAGWNDEEILTWSGYAADHYLSVYQQVHGDDMSSHVDNRMLVKLLDGNTSDADWCARANIFTNIVYQALLIAIRGLQNLYNNGYNRNGPYAVYHTTITDLDLSIVSDNTRLMKIRNKFDQDPITGGATSGTVTSLHHYIKLALDMLLNYGYVTRTDVYSRVVLSNPVSWTQINRVLSEGFLMNKNLDLYRMCHDDTYRPADSSSWTSFEKIVVIIMCCLGFDDIPEGSTYEHATFFLHRFGYSAAYLSRDPESSGHEPQYIASFPLEGYDPMVMAEDGSSLEANPFLIPPKFTPGSAAIAITATLAIAVIVATTIISVRLSWRNHIRKVIVKKEIKAMNSQERLKTVNPENKAEYNAALKDYLRDQRKFQRYATRVGYASNNVGSYFVNGSSSGSGGSGSVSDVLSVIEEKVDTYYAPAADFIAEKTGIMLPDLTGAINGNVTNLSEDVADIGQSVSDVQNATDDTNLAISELQKKLFF